MPITRGCVQRDSVAQTRWIDLQMALVRNCEAGLAASVLVVVSMHELSHPAARLQQVVQRFDEQPQPVFSVRNNALEDG